MRLLSILLAIFDNRLLRYLTDGKNFEIAGQSSLEKGILPKKFRGRCVFNNFFKQKKTPSNSFSEARGGRCGGKGGKKSPQSSYFCRSGLLTMNHEIHSKPILSCTKLSLSVKLINVIIYCKCIAFH